MKEGQDTWNRVERRFLNKESYHSTAAIVAKITENRYGNIPFVEFFISNCDRTISLDMDCDTVEDVDNSIYKMQQIIEVATFLQNNLRELRPYIEKEENKEKSTESLAEKVEK